MSSNIIPMLPSTPPPLDESVESDDDELGNFTAVLGKYDDSLTEVPQSACDESQTKTDKNNCTNHYVQSRNDINIQKTEIHLGNSYKHFSDFPGKSVVKEKSPDDDRKINRKSSLESIRNGKVERIAPEVQDKICLDGSGRYSPILNDTESLNDSLKIKQGFEDDSVCLAKDDHQLQVAPSIEGDTILHNSEISIIQDSNRTAVSFVSEIEDASVVQEPLEVIDKIGDDMLEEGETEMMGVPSQQYENTVGSEDSSTFILPLVPKPTETISFQHKSNVDSLEPSPISASENFTSVSDVSSEFSNFETAKSSPNSTDSCDKQGAVSKSESSSICVQQKKQSEHEIRSRDSADENSCSSVSPLVFQENIPMESEVDDDDFAEFQQANEDIHFPSSILTMEKSSEFLAQDFSDEDAAAERNDDFADFPQAAADDDFADFESAPETSWSHSQDDFADFEQASFENGTQKDQTEDYISPTEVPDKGKGKVMQLVHASFPIIYEEKTPETDEVFPFKNETDYTSLLLRGRSKRLWDRLQDLDTTPAMLFRWGSSQCFQAMLHALNIDSHSILRNPSVPIFASSLGLLEPTKGPQSPKPQATVNKHISFQEAVPPAQFDWTDSGLINPLDTSQASSLFDLDFFMAQNAVPSATDVAGSELEVELFGPSTVHVSSGDKDTKSPLITQILASTKSTIFPSAQRQCSRPAGLSEEAVRVLDKLPDLSFMQAKVLMFPIHDLSDH